MQNLNLNIAVNDRLWPDFDVWRMSNWGMGYMPLKHLHLGWCGQNMKAISYMLNSLGWCGRNMKAISYILQQSCTFQNLTTAVNDKVWPDLDLGRRSNWGRGVYYWKVLPITKTRLYNFDPLEPHFYIVKLGFTGVYIIFLISAQNTDCGYSLEPPCRGGSNEYPQSMFWAEMWKNRVFWLKIFSFWRWNFPYIWIGVFS